MDVKEFLEAFDVTASESKLKILSCSPWPIPDTTDHHWADKNHGIQGTHSSLDINLTWVEPKQISHLPFEDQSFHLALCFNVLFINSTLSESLHLNALEELSRVATEVRVFPLMDPKERPSHHLGPVLKILQEKGYGVELKEIKSKAMLRLWNPSCAVQASSERSL